MLNLIVSLAAVAFAATIAARSESGPPSFVFLTTNVAALARPVVESPTRSAAPSIAPKSERLRAIVHPPCRLRCGEAARELRGVSVVRVRLRRGHRLACGEQ